MNSTVAVPAAPAAKPSRFVMDTPSTGKKPIAPEALEQFASGSQSNPTPASVVKATAPADVPPQVAHAETKASTQTKHLLLRMSPDVFNRLEQVFIHSTFKSKQTMVEKLLMEGVEELAKKLGI